MIVLMVVCSKSQRQYPDAGTSRELLQNRQTTFKAILMEEQT